MTAGVRLTELGVNFTSVFPEKGVDSDRFLAKITERLTNANVSGDIIPPAWRDFETEIPPAERDFKPEIPPAGRDFETEVLPGRQDLSLLFKTLFFVDNP